MTSRFWGAGQSGLVGGFPSGSFTPASLFTAGVAGGWYDASDLSSLYQDSAGTTPVAASTDPVGKWLDKSGNGNHVIQATAGARPLYQAGAGLPYVEADGVDDTLQVNFAGTYNQPTTFFVACKFNATAGTPNVLDMNSGGGRYNLGINAGQFQIFAGLLLNQGAAAAVATVLIGEFNGAGSTIQRDNVAAVTGNAGAQVPASGSFNLFDIGGGGAGGFMSGRIYAGGFINRLLTVSEKNSLRTWLGAKAGLVL